MSLPRYPEYKDSGVSWLGDVPSHWPVQRFDTATRTHRESISANSLTGREVLHYSIPSIQESGAGVVEDGASIDSNKLVVNTRQLLVSKLNPHKQVVVVAEPHDELLTVASTELVPLIPTRANVRYMSYVWQSYTCLHYLLARSDSATRSHTRVAPDYISKMKWAWPSDNEQVSIADFLDSETAKIDALIAEQEKLIALLEEKRQATISHAVTRGLNPDAPMKDSGVEWLGEIPQHWDLMPFRYCVDYQEGPGILSVDFKEEGVPLIRVAGVQDRWASLDGCNYLDPRKVASQWEHFRLSKGELLISASASMGTVCEVGEDVVGAVPYTGIIRLRGVRGKVIDSFIRHFVVSKMFSMQIDLLKSGATIQHFGPSHLRQVVVAKPPIEEQKIIAAWIDGELGRFDQLVAQAQSVVALLRERRSALLTAAVTGQIDVRNAVDLSPEQLEAVAI